MSPSDEEALVPLLVVDTEDSIDTSHAIRALASETTLVVQVAPGTRNLQWLASAVLKALGKDSTRDRENRAAFADWEFVGSWLAASRVQTIVFQRGQELPIALVPPVMGLACMLGIRVAVVAAGFQAPYTLREALLGWGARVEQLDDWLLERKAA